MANEIKLFQENITEKSESKDSKVTLDVNAGTVYTSKSNIEDEEAYVQFIDIFFKYGAFDLNLLFNTPPGVNEPLTADQVLEKKYVTTPAFLRADIGFKIPVERFPMELNVGFLEPKSEWLSRFDKIAVPNMWDMFSNYVSMENLGVSVSGVTDFESGIHSGDFGAGVDAILYLPEGDPEESDFIANLGSNIGFLSNVKLDGSYSIDINDLFSLNLASVYGIQGGYFIEENQPHNRFGWNIGALVSGDLNINKWSVRLGVDSDFTWKETTNDYPANFEAEALAADSDYVAPEMKKAVDSINSAWGIGLRGSVETPSWENIGSFSLTGGFSYSPDTLALRLSEDAVDGGGFPLQQYSAGETISWSADANLAWKTPVDGLSLNLGYKYTNSSYDDQEYRDFVSKMVTDGYYTQELADILLGAMFTDPYANHSLMISARYRF